MHQQQPAKNSHPSKTVLSNYHFQIIKKEARSKRKKKNAKLSRLSLPPNNHNSQISPNHPSLSYKSSQAEPSGQVKSKTRKKDVCLPA